MCDIKQKLSHSYTMMPVQQTFVPMFGYPYHMDTISPPPPPQDNNSYVLDLSIKRRHPSPDYTICYPSPKFSPTYGHYEHSIANDLTSASNIQISRPVATFQDASKSIQIPKISPKFLSGSSLTHMPKPSPSYSISDGVSDSSEHSDRSNSPCSHQRKKVKRPFKSITKEPSLDFGVTTASESEINNLIQESAQSFAEFRDRIINQIQTDSTGTNKNMRRVQHNSEKLNDPEYLEKRRKNNEAAKKSRDARKQKQDEMAIRMAFLEREHMMLKCRLDAEKEDLDRLQKLTTGKQN